MPILWYIGFVFYDCKTSSFPLLSSVQVVVSPVDLINVRMKADGHLGKPMYSGLEYTFVKISRVEGVAGIWSCVFPNVQRDFLVNMR